MTYKKIVFSLVVFGAFLLNADIAQAATVTCYNTAGCTLNYQGYVGTVTIDPQCNASSPASYNWSLTVNDKTVTGTRSGCPVVSINVSF